MRINGFAGSYEVSEPVAKETPSTDHFFRSRMKREGIVIEPGETVTDYIRSNGFPFSVQSSEERSDN